jgi:F420-non-reducing hydrogenase iron-sulfur subunit
VEESRSAAADIAVTAFVCANCARHNQTPDSAARSRPVVPSFDWPFPVREVLVPCTGRIQPEHVLKAFESGADVVCTIACEEDNCHYLEGSVRCARRVDYLRGILDEVGLGGGRLMLFHLPGTAAQDTALAAGRPATVRSAATENAQVAAIRDEISRALDHLAHNPLNARPVDEAAEDPYQQVDTSDDVNED